MVFVLLDKNTYAAQWYIIGWRVLGATHQREFSVAAAGSGVCRVHVTFHGRLILSGLRKQSSQC